MVGFNYVKISRTVVKFGTIRIIPIVFVAFKWPLRKIDANNAFLKGIIIK